MNWFHPHLVDRRATMAQWVVWGVVAVLLAAFFRVQILASSRYELASEQNRLRAVPLPAPRGLVLDRNGVVLAENVPGYTVALLAASPDSLAAVLQRIGPLLGVRVDDIPDVLRRYRLKPSEPVTVRRDVSFETVSALEERRVLIPGLVIQMEPKRRYPFGPLLAHTLGYVSEITEPELQQNAFPGARLGTLVGRDGLEREYDARLRGKDGLRFVEVDALGRTVRDQGVAPPLDPVQGETIRTTLDVSLQRFVAEVFPANRRGAVVVLDPRTGGLLAMFSAPSFDPNEFIGGIDPALWRDLSQADDHPLIDRAIQAAYPPASPWKLLVAAVALKRGIVQADSRMPIPCRGGLQYYSRYFRCWKLQGHGDLTLTEAIKYSCDVYFYQLGLRLGLPTLLQEAGALGMHEALGVDLPNERASFLPASTEYYNRRYGPRGWTSAVTLNLAIGQGENVQTPLNMAYFYAMLASPTGRTPPPHVVAPRTTAAQRQLQLSASELADLRTALISVVEGGTATASRIADLHIAGKTGTAQNAHGADHGWFIAFAPAEAPSVVVAAIVEFAEHGSAVAPMVTRIIARHLRGPDAVQWTGAKIVVPEDSAPAPVPIVPEEGSRAGRRPGIR
ncbi:MAG: penicillin-binding protein 2 [Gemmatimonadota bacterium]|nr:penicillin-binding protein 2 [Gemmatimonadota bacterium]